MFGKSYLQAVLDKKTGHNTHSSRQRSSTYSLFFKGLLVDPLSRHQGWSTRETSQLAGNNELKELNANFQQIKANVSQ